MPVRTARTWTGETPIIEICRIGHRGAPHEFPANTMRGFQRAHELGCDMVECDIRRSSDGIIVLAHDPYVTDVNGIRYEISSTSAELLGSLDLGAGEGVPTLEQLVAWALAAGTCAVMADMKCEGESVEELVAELLSPLPNNMRIVPGAGFESRKRFREIDPNLPLSLSLGAEEGERLLLNFDMMNLLDSIDTNAVTWQYSLLSKPTIRALQSRGLTVYAWTVDDMAIATRLAKDGVDGVISNRPDLLAGL